MKKILLHIFLFLSYFAFSQNTEITLNATWQFHKKGSEAWFPAKVPGNVHSDLLQNKQIPDPFLGDNEKKVQWVENEDWEYKASFKCDKKILSQSNIELKFEGLDTYAKVYLNEKLILESDNMFRSWIVNVKNFIKEGENSLLIVFESAVKKGKAEAAKLPYALPGDEKVFTRKAQYQYGWDWAPRFVTCGIWKPIKLITWNKVKIESIHAITKSINDSVAEVDFVIETNCDTDDYYDIRYTHSSRNADPAKINTKLVHLKQGIATTTLSSTILDPRLWWCNGMVDRVPYLYTAGFKITKDNALIEQQGLEYGIRTIELVQTKDTAGSSFYFKLNGEPVFMKGANYVPQHSFPSNTGKSDYRKLLTMARDAKMNMLRVWGGGVYPDDEFYKDCDKAGILVWQDFMFACAMYPGDKDFTENVRSEVAEQVKRSRAHPCLALWCGNNEIDEGWNNWGWQKQYKYSKADSLKIYSDYKKLFHELLPEIVKQNDPKTSFITTSPAIGWGHKESLTQGDSHYWGIWWGNEPFENYEKKVGRFMSEYGFQSLPSLETFKSFCEPTELNLNSATVKNHQKHPKGFETITTYMERDFIVPKEFEKFIYVSQLLQAQGMKTAIEAHRRAKPYCMGTLFWQLNDCWPATSWSAIDFYNTPKAFYYSLPKLYDNVLVSVKKDGENFQIYLVNDDPKEYDGKLSLSICDFSGKEFFKKEIELKILPNSSQSYFSLSQKNIKDFSKDKIYLSCRFVSIGQNINKTALYYFTVPKDLKLPSVKPQLNYDPVTGTLKIKSNQLIKNLYLSSGNTIFSDNYFDLEPNQEVQIKLKPPVKSIAEIKYMSLKDINP